MRFHISALAVFLAVVALISNASAAALFGWQVVDVPASDVLNVRAFPSAKSAVLVGYSTGTRLSLTGRCTGGLDLNSISGQPGPMQQASVRGRWCEVWLDPTGNGSFRSGWVNGRYIKPL
jgi:hypothetical protein